MYKSKDSTININVARSSGFALFAPADWSIINLLPSPEETKNTFNNIYQTPTNRHVMLAVCRQKRKERLQAISNVKLSGPFNYLETVNISYEKPKACSNNGFLPLSEPGFVFYKGNLPSIEKTKWFREDYNNATNTWDLSVQDPISEGQNSYYQRFSWELNLILLSLASPLSLRRFIYALPLNEDEQKSMFEFCHKYHLKVEILVEESKEAIQILKNYEEFLKNRRTA
jgi:hypothetical protein